MKIMISILMLIVVSVLVLLAVDLAHRKPSPYRIAIPRLVSLSNRIVEFHKSNNKLPNNLDELEVFLGSNTVSQAFIDYWGKRHFYQVLSNKYGKGTRSFLVGSAGPDGVVGTDDDITRQAVVGGKE